MLLLRGTMTYSIAEIQKQCDALLTERKLLTARKKDIQKELEKEQVLLRSRELARVVLQRSAILVHEHLSHSLSHIVTEAIRTIFDEELTFECKFQEKRNNAECVLRLLNEDGEEVDIFEGDGGGLADCISLFLRIAYVMLAGQRAIIFLDEPCKHLDTEGQQRAGQVLKQLSEELKLQIVMITHSTVLASYADKRYHVKLVNKISQVQEI
jgi:DNA repair exonuclease SbcCD ATPase subunit